MNKRKEQQRRDSFWQQLGARYRGAQGGAVPHQIAHLNFRLSGVNDEALGWLTEHVRVIGQLDLDETDITYEGMEYLTRLESLRELRLKGCTLIDDRSVAKLCAVNGLELLHLGGTSITVEGMKPLADIETLKTLLISAPGGAEEELTALAILLSKDCELVVNSKVFELP